MTAISKEQIRMMHGVARRAGMDTDDLHAMVYEMCGKESIRALTCREGIKVIDRLKQRAGEEPMVPAGRATGAQRAMICSLERELGWGNEPERLRGFLRARFGVESINWLTDKKASAAINALKAMVAGCRGERKRGAQG